MKYILFYEPPGFTRKNNAGGALYSLLNMVKSLDRKKFNVTVVLYQDYNLAEEFERLDCRVVRLDAAYGTKGNRSIKRNGASKPVRRIPVKRFLKEVYFLVKKGPSVRRLAHFLETEKIDIVHCNSIFPWAVEAVLAAQLTRTPCICHSRSYIGETSPVFRWIGRRVDRHIAISESIRRNLMEQTIPAEKTELVHNWIVTKGNRPLQTDPQGHDRTEDFRILSVGRIIPWKGQHLLVDLGRRLREEGIRFSIHIFGDTKDREEYVRSLQDTIREAGLESNIRFRGYRRYEEIYREPFHLAVHTSVSPEPFGRVIIEAMYNRIPVVASMLGGTTDIIRENVNGLLFDPGKPRELQEAVKRLIMDERLRLALGKRGHTSVREKFSEAGKMEQLESLYVHLSGERDRSAPVVRHS